MVQPGKAQPRSRAVMALRTWGGKTREARLVRQLDKLEMAMQAWEYAKGLGDPSAAREFSATARKHITDDELLALLRRMEF